MVDRETLEPGETYFSVFYVDEELRIPSIETYVYLGSDVADEATEPRVVHLFQYAHSYFSDGNWNDLSAETKDRFDEAPLISFEGQHLEPIFDADGLLVELQQWRGRL